MYDFRDCPTLGYSRPCVFGEMRTLFAITGMVGSVTPLWVLERNDGGIEAVALHQT